MLKQTQTVPLVRSLLHPEYSHLQILAYEHWSPTCESRTSWLLPPETTRLSLTQRKLGSPSCELFPNFDTSVTTSRENGPFSPKVIALKRWLQCFLVASHLQIICLATKLCDASWISFSQATPLTFERIVAANWKRVGQTLDNVAVFPNRTHA